MTYVWCFLRSSYTSGRDIFNDYAGNCGYDFVQIGNCLASRLILLLLLCCVRGCRWLVEQPEGSTLASTRRFQEFLGLTRVSWLHLHKKRTVHMSNCACLFPLHLHVNYATSAHPELRCTPHLSGWEHFKAKRPKGIVYGAMTKDCWIRSSTLVGIWAEKVCNHCLGQPLFANTLTSKDKSEELEFHLGSNRASFLAVNNGWFEWKKNEFAMARHILKKNGECGI